MKERLKYTLFLLPVIVLFIPFTGQIPLFDWVEIGFAEAAKQMVTTGNYFIIKMGGTEYAGYQPLYLWMQAISMKIFGINEFAIRFPNLICGIVTLCTVFYFGYRLVNNQFGYLWALFYASSLIPFLYFRFGTIEPWYNLFILLGFYCVYKYFLISNKKQKGLFAGLSGLFFGLAVLVNSIWVIAILALSMVVFSIIKMFKVQVKFRHVALFLIVLIVTGFGWYLVEIFKGHTGYVISLFKSQCRQLVSIHSGSEGFFLIYLIVLFIGSFPSSILALNIVRRQRKDDREPLHEFRNWMMIIFLVIIGILLLKQPRISNYSTFTFFPLTFFATYVVIKLSEQRPHYLKWTFRFILLTGVLIGIAVVIFYTFYYYRDFFLGIRIFKLGIVRKLLDSNIIINNVLIVIGLAYISGLLVFFLSGKFKLINKLTGTAYLTLFLNLFILILVINPVIAFRQNPLITFCEEKKNEDCYICPVGMLSYAHLFYGDKKKDISLKKYLDSVEYRKSFNKTVYFIFKSDINKELLNSLGNFQIIKEENGFVFALAN